MGLYIVDDLNKARVSCEEDLRIMKKDVVAKFKSSQGKMYSAFNHRSFM